MTAFGALALLTFGTLQPAAVATAPVAPVEVPAAVPSDGAPLPLFPTVTLRVGLGAGLSDEGGATEGAFSLAGGLLVGAGRWTVGLEVAARQFDGTAMGVGSALGWSFSVLGGTGWALSPGLRLQVLGELGRQNYEIATAFLSEVTGSESHLPYAGCRIGLDALTSGRSGVGLHAFVRRTLGTATEEYLETEFWGSPVAGVARYGGTSVGLELVFSLGIGAGRSPRG